MDNINAKKTELDDLEFRRNIFADPKSRDEALLNAKRNDPSKQQLALELELLDDKIYQALAVPVPENLSEKLILRQTMQSHQQHKRKKRVHLAMAASVAMVFGVFLNSFLFTSAYSTLGEHALAHVEHESYSNNADSFVALAALNDKMEAFGGQFSSTAGKLLSVNFCWFDGMRSLHLVYQGENSPITVLVVPENEDLSFTASFSSETLQGKSQKFKGANVIVVGDKSEKIDVLQQQLSKNIRWQA